MLVLVLPKNPIGFGCGNLVPMSSFVDNFNTHCVPEVTHIEKG